MKLSKYERRSHDEPRSRRPRVPGSVILSVALGAVALAALGAWNSLRPETHANGDLPTGPLQVLGVEVLQPVADRGTIPLNTPTEATWYLRNTGTTAIKLDRPSIEVLEGC